MDDSSLVLLIGGIFLAVGFIFVLWGLRERKAYMSSLVERQDMREFLTRWPERWWLNTLVMGGWIALAVGAVLLVLGLIFWLTG